MYDSNNTFAKIIRGEIQAQKVYEDDKILAFHDAFPAAPIHILVVPKGEYLDYADFIKNADKEDILQYFNKINEIATQFCPSEGSFRICSNKGAISGQSVFHFHTHILSGSKFGSVV